MTRDRTPAYHGGGVSGRAATRALVAQVGRCREFSRGDVRMKHKRRP